MTKVAVVGAGTMGNGIAHVFAQHGHAVTLMDVDRGALEKALKTIRGNMDRQVKKQTMTEADRDAALGRITTATALDGAAGAALVVEAASEQPAVKFEIFRTLDAMVGSETILASNTSSISITEIAAQTGRADRVIGMHFMNPVPLMQLVEIIRGLQTSDRTYERIEAATRRMGKTPVEVNDAPGFVSNRVLMPMINEAIYCLHEGVGDAAAIDEVMKLGMNHPMGPLALADLIGLDVCLDILRVLHEGLGEDKYRPCPLLVRMVDAGWLGRKSGRGFHEYPARA
jgi:3-hydroxybutyryl-CoA dehydrogenase